MTAICLRCTLIALGILAVIVIAAFALAPEGYEDDDGFHYGKR